jgi:type I site-specific restriction-modification system R (restriction) subunit
LLTEGVFYVEEVFEIYHRPNLMRAASRRQEALELGKTIIVTTLQKFPVIAKEIGELPGKRFAVIVDEAHSSQSGESTKSLKAVLASDSLETSTPYIAHLLAVAATVLQRVPVIVVHSLHA